MFAKLKTKIYILSFRKMAFFRNNHPLNCFIYVSLIIRKAFYEVKK